MHTDRIFGVVPSHDAGPQLGIGNLMYHGGPVMHSNTTRAIYWFPAGSSYSANYVGVNNGFLQNVAADSGRTTNVYFTATQYSDSTSGKILYSSSFAGSVIDTNPFPASGCADVYTAICLSDAQLRTEISRVISAQGWPRGTSNLYFIYTPKNVGSCFSTASCAFTNFCAYHSSFGSGSSATLYANQPYAAFVRSCDSGQHPNGNDADATINVVSHAPGTSATPSARNVRHRGTGFRVLIPLPGGRAHARPLRLAISVDDTAAVEVVRRELDADAVARKDPDPVAAHLASRVAEGLVAVVECDPEHPVSQCLDDLALELDLLFLAGDN